jgi:hypothetical protein
LNNEYQDQNSDTCRNYNSIKRNKKDLNKIKRILFSKGELGVLNLFVQFDLKRLFSWILNSLRTKNICKEFQ